MPSFLMVHREKTQESSHEKPQKAQWSGPSRGVEYCALAFAPAFTVLVPKKNVILYLKQVIFLDLTNFIKIVSDIYVSINKLL